MNPPFRRHDGVNGKELWKSDGTSSGTVMVKDIRPGSSGSWPVSINDVAIMTPSIKLFLA